MDGRYWGHSHRSTQAMSEEQLKAFLEAVKSNATLQEKLNAASDADSVVAIAKDAGFVISAEIAKEVPGRQELSDEELESAAGGWCNWKTSDDVNHDNTGDKCRW